ncbi:protein kinase domain-containing protein [Marinibactrum halimedae]|uniref:Protein kinase domain-containing protein n=1 Tax=Marinibactrum halimedae TaxID=1444977 RepID=A0AA37WM47_9GAMM|nr:protein kinase [Marinibactrum halimedae]MCD9458972.1 protein kinase [Marinibactrum halimedae]GLS26899.1 hypothetical protein GCM10007877_26180 [Marinibactrum halimedae]
MEEFTQLALQAKVGERNCHEWRYTNVLANCMVIDIDLPGYQLQTAIFEDDNTSIWRANDLAQSRSRRIVITRALPWSTNQSPDRNRLADHPVNIHQPPTHHNIAVNIEQGRLDSGHVYWVNDYRPAKTLQTLLFDKPSNTQALYLAIQLCKALMVTHHAGLAHGFLLPKMIMVNDDGQLELMGLSNRDALFITEKEAYFLAPECRALQEKSVEGDVFSVAALVYRFLTGHTPMVSMENAEVALSDRLSRIPPLLNRVISASLSPHQNDRPRSASVLLQTFWVVARGTFLPQTPWASTAKMLMFLKMPILDVIHTGEMSSMAIADPQAKGEYLRIKIDQVNSDFALLGVKPLVVIKRWITKERDSEFVFKQQKKLMGMAHSAILPPVLVKQRSDSIWTCFAYCSGGNLTHYWGQLWTLDETVLLMRQLCAGLLYAHRSGVVHGNVCATNVVFSTGARDVETGGLAQSLSAKLTDFGFERPFPPAEYGLGEEKMTKARDVFGLGVLLYRLLVGEFPRWRDQSLQMGRRFNSLPKNVRHLIQQMLYSDPKQRPTMTEVGVKLQALSSEPVKQEKCLQSPRQKERQKILLLLLLILLAQMLINTGVITALS